MFRISFLFLQRARWSSKSHNNKETLGNDVPDVELTTASELKGRSLGDQDQEDDEHLDDLPPISSDDEDELLPPRRNYKVQSSLVSPPSLLMYHA
jgi:hypothetical protein